jgi:hypothetical protein
VQDGRRTIVLSSFPNYVKVQDIGLDPNNPPYAGSGNEAKNLYIPLINNTSGNLYIFQIDLAKVGGGNASANEIWFGSTKVWSGTRVPVSTDPNNPTPFPFNQILSYTFSPGSITELIKFQSADAVSGGTWYCTFHYSVNVDLSNPQTCTVSFTLP